ncbi:alpha/beta fold hydrolase [Sphingomonas sp. TREG-RG-20F-R18-01]|uniref:esterase/lipase family protein n=1 Tax=Sphingomonas sp. TREG-RG-20F-R18-01 TaxID=2914982 RepID=UPI001F569DF8|nr:alpha/beta fold hydrolase [Sphingomonas sp. TREG-RG-20F-R18-01]
MRPPSRLLWAAELPRAAFGLASLLGAQGKLAKAPRGDGRPILLLPGLINSDRSLVVLRRYLNQLGYRAEGWGLGRNFGVRAIGNEGALLLDRVRALHAETGERVTLIGVSLGGIMARYAAHRLPDMVREVVTISSPFAGSPRATNVWRSFQVLTGEQIDAPNVLAQRKLVAEPLPVPSTAIWSRSDGFVNGMICHDTNGRTIEVRSSHVLVQVRPEVLLAVARVLGESARDPMG